MESGEKLFWGALGAFVLYAVHQQQQASSGIVLYDAARPSSLGNFADHFTVANGHVYMPPNVERGAITQNTGLPIAQMQKDFGIVPQASPWGTPKPNDDYVDQSNGRSFAQIEADQTKYTQQHEAEGQSEFNRTHAKAVYCGPGCYDYYDEAGNLTSAGKRGQSAGSLLADVAIPGLSGGW